MRAWNVLKYFLFAMAAAAAIFAVIICSIGLQFLEFNLAYVIGYRMWAALYLLLPTALFITLMLIAVYNRKKGLKKTAVIAAVTVCLYAVVSLASMIAPKIYFKSFSAEKWAKNFKVRYMMLDDLKRKYNFIGMTRDEVTAVLGEPIKPYADPNGADIMEYVIDFRGIDPTMLTLVLDSGRVTEVYTYSEYRSTAKSIY